MKQQPPRPFDDNERAFLVGVAAELAPADRERLLNDTRVALVTVNGDFLDVALPDYERPEYRGHRNLPFEGEMRDADDGPMSVLVNMDKNGRLLAVEFIWWQNPSTVAPDWSTLKVIPEWPMGNSGGN